MKTKVLIGVTLFVLLVIGLLWTYAENSEAHAAAVDSIRGDVRFAGRFGTIDQLLLVGARYKYRTSNGETLECAEQTYFILGEKGQGFASVYLRRQGRRGWDVYETESGYFVLGPQASCGSSGK